MSSSRIHLLANNLLKNEQEYPLYNNENKIMDSGTVVVFEPNNFNPEFWKQLPEQDKIKYYGPLGYGSDKKKFFVFLTEIKNAPGHCILVDLDDGHLEVMRHISDFREVNEEEF